MRTAAATSVVVAAWVGSTNLGDELVFAGLAAKLGRHGVSDVLPVSVDPAGTRADHGVGAVRGRDLVTSPAVLGDGAAMVFGGGGLVQDVTSPFNLPLHLSRTWVARLRGVPFAAVGLGAGPLATPTGRALARRSLAAAVGVSCRDDASADLLAAIGLPRPQVGADLALSLPRPDVAPADRVVVCLRPWTGRRALLPAALRARTARRPAPEWFVDSAARGLDAVAARTGLAIHLVAFQRGRDDEVHRLVADRMRAPVTTATPDVANVLAEVAAARVVVGMRYHAGIAATIAGVPSVLVGYTTKVPSLAADLGPGAVGLGWDAAGLGRLPDAVDAVLGRGADVEAAHDRLLVRDRVNDRVLDQLLGR